jgi:MFS family permease
VGLVVYSGKKTYSDSIDGGSEMRLNLKMLAILTALTPVVAVAGGADEEVVGPIAGAIAGILVTAIFFVSIAAIIIVAIIVRFRINALRHEERALAIERGQELPVEPIRRRDMSMDALRAGLLLTALGVSLAIALGVVCGPTQAVWGGIPFFLGVASLIFVPLYRKFGKD